MMLYDIFYRGGAMDSCVPLSATPPPDAEYARNVNWDRHTLTPINGKWVGKTQTRILVAPHSVYPAGPGGWDAVTEILESLSIVTSKRIFYGQKCAEILEEVEDAKGNDQVLMTSGWKLMSR